MLHWVGLLPTGLPCLVIMLILLCRAHFLFQTNIFSKNPNNLICVSAMFCIYCYIFPPPSTLKTYLMFLTHWFPRPHQVLESGRVTHEDNVRQNAVSRDAASSHCYKYHLATPRLELPLVRSNMIIGSSSCLLVESARFFVNHKALCECLHSISSLFDCPLYHAFCNNIHIPENIFNTSFSTLLFID